MYKYKFFKNNNEVKINEEEISYFCNDLIIKKKNNNSTIILDFKNKLCGLKMMEFELDIPVKYMSYELTDEEDTFSYSLASEEKIKNTIIINKKK